MATWAMPVARWALSPCESMGQILAQTGLRAKPGRTEFNVLAKACWYHGHTGGTAQGSGGNFKNNKFAGEVGYCE